jgi:hypothetical protein
LPFTVEMEGLMTRTEEFVRGMEELAARTEGLVK